MSVSKDLLNVMKSLGKKGTTPVDTEAEVVRVDGNIAWVHVPGGVSETPVQLTINAKKGDTVQVRIANGRAWINGNKDAPPTDDSKADTALKAVDDLGASLDQRMSDMSDELSEDIEDAAETAEVALTSANGKNTIYHSAVQPSGGEYKENDVWFDSAHDYAMYKWNGTAWIKEQFGNEAIKDLAITNAKIANATISDAKISTIDAGKITSGVIDSARINTSAITIGESQVTGLTSDLAGKASNADVADAATKATSFITQITGGGIKVHDSGNVNTNYAKITSDGMEVYKSGSQVAKFGESIEFPMLQISAASNNQKASIISKLTNLFIQAYGGIIEFNASRVAFDNVGTVSGITASMVGAAPSGHDHDDRYVSKSGGTMTGTLTVPHFYLNETDTTTYKANLYRNSGNWVRETDNSSSRRYKNSIKPIELDELDPHHLYDIEVVQFKYNKDHLSNKDDIRYDRPLPGFIAEQVYECYPVAVDPTDDGRPKTWNEQYLIPPMLALIQEQHRRITALEQTVAALSQKVAKENK